VAVRAHSLIRDSCTAFGIYAGNPARHVRKRKRDLLDLEQQFRAEQTRSR
jgi:galactoside O-acetyltransferase